MPDVLLIIIFFLLLILWIVSLVGVKETDGASLLMLIVVLPLSIIFFVCVKNYNNVPWEYLPPRYVEIEKRGDQYIAIDLEENKVYNILSMIGRIPKDNEVVRIRMEDTSKIYNSIKPTGPGHNRVDVVEKK